MFTKREKRSVLVDVRSSKMVYVTCKSSLLNVQRRDHGQRIEMHQSEVENLKGMFPERSSEFVAFLISLLCRAK